MMDGGVNLRDLETQIAVGTCPRDGRSGRRWAGFLPGPVRAHSRGSGNRLCTRKAGGFTIVEMDEEADCPRAGRSRYRRRNRPSEEAGRHSRGRGTPPKTQTVGFLVLPVLAPEKKAQGPGQEAFLSGLVSFGFGFLKVPPALKNPPILFCGSASLLRSSPARNN